MNKIIYNSILLLFFTISTTAQDIAPYFKVGESLENINQLTEKIVTALKTNSFTVLGTYNPANKSSLKVITFTKTSLKNTAIKVKDRGALAAVLKIGLVEKNGKVTISYLNPDYIFRAYLRDGYALYKNTLNLISADIKNVLKEFGTEFTPFGGLENANKLKDYHYKIMMPYFTDPVELNEFSSFEEGLKIIENNLKNKIGKTVQVYKLVYPNEKVAVFGVGIQSSDKGEAHFLPIIGEDNIAAMPYEIILQGNKATMLHGKYRIALHWPELTMGTFMKIMSTPGDIEDTLEAVCK